jgi:hypothetical protein
MLEEEKMQENTAAQNWRDIPRSEMFRSVIVAVDAAKGEAVEMGDENFARRCDEQLFPFLENERDTAVLIEMRQAGEA